MRFRKLLDIELLGPGQLLRAQSRATDVQGASRTEREAPSKFKWLLSKFMTQSPLLSY